MLNLLLRIYILFAVFVVIFRIKRVKLAFRSKLYVEIIGVDCNLILFWIQTLATLRKPESRRRVKSSTDHTSLKTGVDFFMANILPIFERIYGILEIHLVNIRVHEFTFNLRGNRLSMLRFRDDFWISSMEFTYGQDLCLNVGFVKVKHEFIMFVLSLLQLGNKETPKVSREPNNSESIDLLANILDKELIARINVKKIRIIAKKLNINVTSKSVFELKEKTHQTLAQLQVNGPYGNILDTSDITISQNGIQSPLMVQMNLKIKFSLQNFHAILKSVLPYLELQKKEMQTEENGAEAVSSTKLIFLVQIPELNVNILLPENVETSLLFKKIKLKNDTENNWVMNSNCIEMYCQIKPQGLFHGEPKQMNIMRWNDFRLYVTKKSAENPIKLQMSVEDAKFTIPFDWPMSNVVENGICLQKAIKRMLFETVGGKTRDFSSGSTYAARDWIPMIMLCSNTTEIIVLDSPFEIKLAQNYKAGYRVNQTKLLRERAFMKKLDSLGISRHDRIDLMYKLQHNDEVDVRYGYINLGMKQSKMHGGFYKLRYHLII
jgi:hypothetical protein